MSLFEFVLVMVSLVIAICPTEVATSARTD